VRGIGSPPDADGLLDRVQARPFARAQRDPSAMRPADRDRLRVVISVDVCDQELADVDQPVADAVERPDE